MLIALLMIAGQNGFNTPQPGVSLAAVASLFGGFCLDGGFDAVGAPAQVRVSWSIINADDANFETHIYQDGVLATTVPSSQTHWDFTMDGLVEEGPFNRFTANSVFRIDIVRKSDSVAVASQETNPWTLTYGTCAE